MALKLNRDALDHAQRLIEIGNIVRDERDQWRAQRPSPPEEDTFIGEHGIDEYARWHLAVDDAQPEGGKRRYAVLIGDFRDLHRGALIDARADAQASAEIGPALEVLLRSVDALV